MKPKLFLHIGTHKTASTVIQNAVNINRDGLRGSGLLYPNTQRGSHPELPKHNTLFETLKKQDVAGFEAEYAAIMTEYEASGCRDMLLSEEAFSEPHFDMFAPLKRFGSQFDIHVICYLRRPDYFLESLWNQRCKEGTCTTPVGPFSRGPFNRQRVHYDAILDWWQSFATVHVINYEEAKAGHILTRFVDVTGYELERVDARAINVSPSAQCALLMAAFNRQGLSFDRRQIIDAFSDDRQKHALGSNLRQELLEHLSDSLARLETRYGLRFDMRMPDEPKVPLNQLKPDICAQAIARLSGQTSGEG